MLSAALLGLIVACALWWAYFDVVAVVAERRFRRMPAELRVRIARDSYSYLHLPMIAGIVLVALGVKKTLGHVDEPLDTVPAVALFGGIALYYAAHVGVPAAQPGHAQPRAPGGADRLARADPARGRGRRADRARLRGGADLRR